MKKVLSICVFTSILGIILALFLLPSCVSNPDVNKQVSSLSKENPDFQRQVMSLKREHTKNVERQISSLQRDIPDVEKQVSLLKRKKDPNIVNLEEELTDKIGMRVFVKNKRNNSGTISLEYKEADQLDRLVEIIKRNY